MTKQYKLLGTWGEQQAVRFLLQRGYRVVCQNFYSRYGEIDIIAWHDKELFGRTLCFIEVKTRTQQPESGVWASSSWKKQQAMQRTAQLYCMRTGIIKKHIPIQFEYVQVWGNQHSGVKEIIHHIMQ